MRRRDVLAAGLATCATSLGGGAAMAQREERARILEPSPYGMRASLLRRGAYADGGEAERVEPRRYFTEGLVDGVPLRTEQVGQLQTPTGDIVACDPFYAGEVLTRPFERRVAPGRYPVILALADLGGWGERVAFAMLKLSSAAPVGWRLALTTHASELFRGLYGVDSGLGMFADLAAAESLAAAQRERAAAQPEGNYYDDVLASCFDGRAWCDHRPEPRRRLNAVIFSSGLGDGVYSTYWGLTDAGDAACLVTDFQLFDREGTILEADAFAKSAVVTKSVLEEKQPVSYMLREEPYDEQDSGWLLTAGEEQAYLDVAENLRIVSLRELARLDDALAPLLRAPAGAAFARGEDGGLAAVE